MTVLVSAEPTLEIDHLSKRFGDVVALSHMTFDVRAGEVFGFVGRNGAGKTTTMRIALGVLTADSGQVRWRGQPVDLQTRRHVGYMPEQRGLYPRMRVAEQLIYLARLHGMDRAAAAAATADWTERLGVAAHQNDELQKLSFGNQQRVQLAAALVHNPSILVLDEPFSGLDPIAVDVMSAVLREKAEAGVAVLFSSHQLDLVERICDRVGIVQAGSMVACGTVAELQASGPQRLFVAAPQAQHGWADKVPGVVSAAYEPHRTELELADDADDQAVLKAALATGPVHEFARHQASLTYLFRDIVTTGSPA